MLNLLAIDTCTEYYSVALSYDDHITCLGDDTPKLQAEKILPMIDSLLTQAGCSRNRLDAIAITRGPGSFTGVRIGVAIAQGLAYALDLPVVPLSSLQVLAQHVADTKQATHVLSAFDARMGEVYWAHYQLQQGLMQLQGVESLATPYTALLPTTGRWHAAGSGWDQYHAELLSSETAAEIIYLPEQVPHAIAMLKLAQHAWQAEQVVAPEKLQPIYLRDQVTNK